MAAELPVPIDFRLPDGWVPASPDEVEASGAAYLAVLPAAEASFTTNITIDGHPLAGDVSLTALADDAVARLQTVVDVSVRDRAEVVDPDAPALSQVLALSTGGLELTQSQVYLSMPDREEPPGRAVIRLTLTVASQQHDAVADDFRQFVETVHPK